MGRGIVESGLFRSERLTLERRTTDPSTTQEGEAWIRTDLSPDTDQLATLRVDNGSGTWDVPIYDQAATTDNVSKALRLEVGGSTGFVPVTTSGGTFDALRMQHDGSTYAFHDALEASVIPDSVVLQYAATTYSGGEPTWSDDTSTENMDLTGGETAETLSDGSDAVGFDGTDDIGLYTVPSSLEGSTLNSFAIEYVWNRKDPQNGRVMGDDDSGSSQRILIEHEVDANFNSSAGNAVFLFIDTNGNRLDVGFNTNVLDDGNRHDITVNVNDLSNNDVDVIIDGSTQSVNLGNAQSPSSFTTWADPWGWGDENNSSKPQDHNVGAIRIHDSPVTSQTIGDYPF